MDGLEQVFQQFDIIRSHTEHAPNPAEHDAPPWQPGVINSEHPVQAGVVTAQHPKEAASPQVDLSESSPQKPIKTPNWNNIRAEKELKAQQLLEERLHAAQAAKTLQDKLKNPNGASLADDEKGLDLAYAADSGLAYDPKTKTEYVRGSHSAQDWIDDFTRVPFWGGRQRE